MLSYNCMEFENGLNFVEIDFVFALQLNGIQIFFFL